MRTTRTPRAAEPEEETQDEVQDNTLKVFSGAVSGNVATDPIHYGLIAAGSMKEVIQIASRLGRYSPYGYWEEIDDPVRVAIALPKPKILLVTANPYAAKPYYVPLKGKS